MPDITMCKNESCEKRYDCYRYMVKPSKYMQSYSYFENNFVGKSCQMFWEILDKNADRIFSKNQKIEQENC
jgi:hypothetical protein